MKRFKKQINNSLIYTFSTIIAKAIPFLLLPIFTSYLSKEDYGMIGLIGSLLAISSIYIGFKPSLFLIVKGSQMDKDNVAIYIYNLFIVSFVSFVIGISLLLTIRYIFFSTIDLYVFILIALLSLFTVFNEVVETIFQIERRAFYYALYQLSKTILVIGLALVFIIILNMGWEGKYFADVIAVCIFAIISIMYLYRNNYIKHTFDLLKQKELFQYLFPLTFHVLGLVMMSSIDRVFLSNMIGLESTGLYTVAYTMGATIGIIHDALLKVWSPEFYKKIKNATIEMKIKILKLSYLYIVSSVILYILFIVLMPYIYSFMVNKKFISAYHLVPIIALGLTFESFRKLFIGYLYNIDKNYIIAMITLSSGILNMIFNYFMIPIYGIDGAAYATLLAYIVVSILTIVIVDKTVYIPWGLK